MKFKDYKEMELNQVYQIEGTSLHIKTIEKDGKEFLMKSMDKLKNKQLSDWNWVHFEIDHGLDFQSYQAVKGYNLIKYKGK